MSVSDFVIFSLIDIDIGVMGPRCCGFQIGPDKAEAREKVLQDLKLEDMIRVEKVQFGAIYRPQANAFRMFDAEYEQQFVSGNKAAWLDMSYDHKDIHIDVRFQY